jgi:hypothetical protein
VIASESREVSEGVREGLDCCLISIRLEALDRQSLRQETDHISVCVSGDSEGEIRADFDVHPDESKAKPEEREWKLMEPLSCAFISLRVQKYSSRMIRVGGMSPSFDGPN